VTPITKEMTNMEMYQIQIFAGSASSLMFMSGTLSMLIKTWRTHDVDSYSMTSLLLNNVGNLVYWIYVISLPVGPIYILHSFYTIATILMLIWYFLYRRHPGVKQSIERNMKRITQTMEIPVLSIAHSQEMRQVQADRG
jgi:uncharacterized protein with PQ loop repeat